MGKDGKRKHGRTGSYRDSGVGETLSQIKRRRLSDESSPLQHSHTNHLVARKSTQHDLDDDGWQVVESKASKKRKENSHNYDENEDCKPQLVFQTTIDNALRINDLQTLVLYVLADEVAPTWVGVKNRRGIKKVLVLMVSGLTREMLEDLAQFIHQDQTKQLSQDDVETNGNHQDDINQQSKSEKKRHSNGSTGIVSVKVPGDTKHGKVFSPLQAMLLVPASNTKDKNSNKNQDERNFKPIRTPITDFLHAADELREAEYPIHPATFTNEIDASLESERRDLAGQSQAAGWVDTNVTSSSLEIPRSSQKSSDFITKGLTIYALDCEMVLTSDDNFSLARISVIDWEGKVIIDTTVQPALPIKNYFTQYSGITEETLKNVTTTLADVQQQLKSLFTSSTILLGHSLESDLNALKLTHPFIIDTSIIYPHPRGLPLRSSLKFLANKYLKREIQMGGAQGHDSVEDAQAVLDLVKMKCERGPKWGTPAANGDSIFRRLANTRRPDGNHRTSAIVEYGTPDKGFGKDASLAVGCQNDKEVEDGMIRAAIEGDGVDFVWGRFRELEFALGWNANTNDNANSAQGQDPSPKPSSEEIQEKDMTSEEKSDHQQTDEVENTPTKLELQVEKTNQQLRRIYSSLPQDTLFIVHSGTGDMRPVVKLQQMHQQYRKEFKVKKWDELSVKWTDDEEQALRKAVDQARKGIGLLCIK